MIAILPRLKPSPLPTVHPVPEIRATGALKAVYEDTKAVLRVPWMGVVTMCFAHYPNFYAALWQGIRPLAGSKEFTAACRSLLTRAEDAAATLPGGPITETLRAQGYSDEELNAIRAQIDIFHAGNMPYLLLAASARLLLEGRPLSEVVTVTPQTAPPPPPGFLTLLEAHHADAPTADVYRDIKATLGLPIVNTDYRALARWPSYFAAAWNGLKPALATPQYEETVTGVHDFCVDLAATLPNPGGLTAETLQRAAAKDAPVAEILEVVRLFQWLLPGLAVNVAVFRAQLQTRG